MKGVVLSIPALRAAGYEVEVWAWRVQPGLEVERWVSFPRLLPLPVVELYVFAFLAAARAWWLFYVLGRPRPEVIFGIAWLSAYADVSLVQFSPWDWERRQRQLGTHSVKDLWQRVTNGVAMTIATYTLRTWPCRIYAAVSKAVAADIKRVNPEAHVQLLPNAYNPVRFRAEVRPLYRAATRQQHRLAEGDVVFLFASMGHYRRKGFHLAAQSVALLRKRYSRARLLVAGGRPAALKALQRELDLSLPDWGDWLTFTGATSEMERYYAAADALLFPSYSEAFALVEVEAAACGLPLFLTRHHGSEMILKDGLNGRWLEFDSTAIAAVLEEFVSGRWVPQPVEVEHLIDSNEYAQRLLKVLSAARLPSTRTTLAHATA
jgi:glycosyltransferase involved in cell wall biosynthesis